MSYLNNIGIAIGRTIAPNYKLGKKIASLNKKIVDYEVTGLENIPEIGPAIIVSNHESYFDIIGTATTIDREVKFIAKRELFEPKNILEAYAAGTMENTGQLKVDRRQPTSNQMKSYIRALNQGDIVIIYPEGTRREGLYEFKGLVSVLAYRKNIPVIPTAVVGSKAAEKKIQKKWKENKLSIFSNKPTIQIKFGEPIYLEAEQGADKNRKKELINGFSETLRIKVGKLMGLTLEEIAKTTNVA